ncbi:MAG: exodeoxyribonuclease V subunit gamma, partial [Nocardioidaceae bacterium]|nr:exodeoxyribonuclease V subunit gamma [Nocardioidaceae bacterium]
PGALAGTEPLSFDRSALAGARAAVAERTPPGPFLDGPLPPGDLGDVSLADLRDFFAHPVRTFLRRRVVLSAPLDAQEVDDAIPVSLDALQKWAVGDRLLREVMAGQDPEAVMTAELLRGTLPPGGLGSGSLRTVVDDCQKLLARTTDLRSGTRRSIDVDVDLGDGRRLTGTVAGVHGSRLVSLGYSRLKARQRLSSWIDLLALSAARPDESWTAHAIGRVRAGPTRALAGPLDHRAVDWLRDLVELRDLGMRAPLAAPPATTLAWAEARARELRGENVQPDDAARKEWTTDPNNAYGIQGEDADASHARVYGERAPLSVLLDAGLATYAWRIWEPLLAGAERVGAL